MYYINACFPNRTFVRFSNQTDWLYSEIGQEFQDVFYFILFHWKLFNIFDSMLSHFEFCVNFTVNGIILGIIFWIQRNCCNFNQMNTHRNIMGFFKKFKTFFLEYKNVFIAFRRISIIIWLLFCWIVKFIIHDEINTEDVLHSESFRNNWMKLRFESFHLQISSKTKIQIQLI